MNNKVSKTVITMLITSFMMPTVADARIKGRRRTALGGASRSASSGRSYGGVSAPVSAPIESKTAIGVVGRDNDSDSAGSLPVDPNNKNTGITQNEYKLPENKVKYLNTLRLNVIQAKDQALKQCEGISGAVSKIFALSTTSAVSSGFGTAMAGTALVSGIMKKNKQDVAYAVKDNLKDATGDASSKAVKGENLPQEIKERLETLRDEYQSLLNEENELLIQKDTLSQGSVVVRKNIEGTSDNVLKTITTEIANDNVNDSDELKNINSKLNDISLDKINKFNVIEGIAKQNGIDVNSFIKQGFADDNSVARNLIDKNLKTANTMGHVRTGMMAGASATSLISLGTSAAASVDAGKLSEMMTACNNAILELKKANNKLNTEIASTKGILENELGDKYEEQKPEYMKQAEGIHKAAVGIVGGCKKYETKDIAYVKNLMTASSVISGIGTATALTGAITSGLANTKKAKGNRGYEKKMDITANVMAGITAGTSLTTTGLSSAASVATGKKLQQQAKDCEAALNKDLSIDLSKEVDAIGKAQEERAAEREAKIKQLEKEGKI